MKEVEFRTVSLLKALANPVRYKIILELSDKELTVSELVKKLKREQPVISKHLMRLREERLVSYRTEDNYVFYKLRNKKIIGILKQVTSLVERSSE
jgi:ArsR family transcriptional regulator